MTPLNAYPETHTDWMTMSETAATDFQSERQKRISAQQERDVLRQALGAIKAEIERPGGRFPHLVRVVRLALTQAGMSARPQTLASSGNDGAAPAIEDWWKPIDTAPKDGSRFLACHHRSGVVQISWFGKTSHVPLFGWCEGEDGEDIDLWQPTHWMALPAAPDASA